MTFTEDDELPPPTLPPGVVGRPPGRTVALAVAALVFVGPVAYTPLVNYESWSPKAAVALILLSGGLLAIPGAARRSPRAALAGGILVLVAAGSAALAPNRVVAVWGLYGWGTGAVFVAALVGAWALGTEVRPRDRQLVENAVLAAVALNCVVAIAQQRVDLTFARLAVQQGRSTGLFGGAVSFSQLLALGMGVLATRFATDARRVVVLTVLFGAGVQLSGSRLAILVSVALAAFVVGRNGRRGLLFVVALSVGLLLGGIVHSAEQGATTSRLVEARSGGITARTETWRSGGLALRSRPLLGWGPGSFSIAATRHRTEALAREEGPDRIFADAHNLLVEVAVTTGVLGLLAFLGWIVLIARGAGFIQLLPAGALLAMHLAEPQHVLLTPLAFLWIGLASTDGLQFDEFPRRPPLPMVPVALIPVVLAGFLLFGDFELRQSDLDFTERQATAADQALPAWQEIAALHARNATFLGITRRDRGEFVRARDWRREAVRREPTNPGTWGALGDAELRLGNLAAAERSFRAAIVRNPTTFAGRTALAEVLVQEARVAEAIEVLQEARLLAPDLERKASTERRIADLRP